jgi:hypothetical protein
MPAFDKTPDAVSIEVYEAAHVLCHTQNEKSRQSSPHKEINLVNHESIFRKEKNVLSDVPVDDMVSSFLLTQPSFDLGFTEGGPDKYCNKINFIVIYPYTKCTYTFQF